MTGGGFKQGTVVSRDLYDSARGLKQSLPLQDFGWQCMMFSDLRAKNSLLKKVNNKEMTCFVTGCIGLHQCVTQEVSNAKVGQRSTVLRVSAPGVKNWFITGGGFDVQRKRGKRIMDQEIKTNQVSAAGFSKPREPELQGHPSFSWECQTKSANLFR